MKNIAVLGSTGSIGTSTLDVISLNLDKFSISLLASDSNYKLLIKQCKKFNPKYEMAIDSLVRIEQTILKIPFGQESFGFISSLLLWHLL